MAYFLLPPLGKGVLLLGHKICPKTEVRVYYPDEPLNI